MKDIMKDLYTFAINYSNTPPPDKYLTSNITRTEDGVVRIVPQQSVRRLDLPLKDLVALRIKEEDEKNEIINDHIESMVRIEDKYRLRKHNQLLLAETANLWDELYDVFFSFNDMKELGKHIDAIRLQGLNYQDIMDIFKGKRGYTLGNYMVKRLLRNTIADHDLYSSHQRLAFGKSMLPSTPQSRAPVGTVPHYDMTEQLYINTINNPNAKPHIKEKYQDMLLRRQRARGDDFECAASSLPYDLLPMVVKKGGRKKKTIKKRLKKKKIK
jgi:hypothetical protein